MNQLKKTIWWLWSLATFGAIALLVSFQNCSQPGFVTISSDSAMNVVCDSSGACQDLGNPNSSQWGSQSAPSGSSNQPSPNLLPNPPSASRPNPTNPSTPTPSAPPSASSPNPTNPSTPTPSAPPSLPPTSSPSSAPSQSSSSLQLYNIVAGDEKVCNQSVANLLRQHLLPRGYNSQVVLTFPVCRVGSGCGHSCGKPDSNSCQSANPHLPGQCLSSNDIEEWVKINLDGIQQLRAANALQLNVVAGDRASCENALRDYVFQRANYVIRGSLAGVCSVGGGCGASCGKPDGVTCHSANPQHWGACLIFEELIRL